MKAILQDLNARLGSRAGLIVTRDGLVVAADTAPDVDRERLAALGASILSDVARHLDAAGMGDFTHFEIAADRGKVVLTSAGPVYLLVLVGARMEIGAATVEIRSAARRVAKAAEFSQT